MARPAAEIEPPRWIVSNSSILPDRYAPLRRYRCGPSEGWVCRSFSAWKMCSLASRLHVASQTFYEQAERLHIRINTGFWKRHELSIVVFAAQGRSLSTPAPSRVGAVDADAGGKTFAGAAAVERGILRAARDAGRVAHRRSVAREETGFGSPGVPASTPSSRSRAGARWSTPFTPGAELFFCSSGMSGASRIPRSSRAACCRSRRRRC